MGLNPVAVYRMDITFVTMIYSKNCIVCLKRLEINEKVAIVGPFFKKNSFFTIQFVMTLLELTVAGDWFRPDSSVQTRRAQWRGKASAVGSS